MPCRVLRVDSARDWIASASWLADRARPDAAAEEAVRAIIAAVREKGDEALLDYCRRFDCPNFTPPFRVSPREIDEAVKTVPADILEYISAAAANIRSFHENEREKSWFVTLPDGSILGQRALPLDSCGLYVPGGKGGQTPLLSSLLMNAIPALVAGCPRIVVVSPPRTDGSLNPYLLAAARELGLEEIYRVGGAWSVAALAYGTSSVPKVDLIAGPGNIYVTIAKKLVRDQTGVDMIAGPSEVLVIADDSANPEWIAGDMLSQAEHDPLAAALCLTDSSDLAGRVTAELKNQARTLPRREIVERSLADWGCVALVPNLKIAADIANLVAPEHLEICARDPWALMPQIRHAGAIFLGEHSPEPLGDYFAGPNHVLPTLGTARFSSALSVRAFTTFSNIIAASPEFLRASSRAVAALARVEGLEAHARSAESRGNPSEKRQ